jgi:RNA polymerase sigma factor (sigma-70 family)
VGLEVVVKAFGREVHAFIWRLAGRNDDGAQEVFADWLQRVLSRTPSFDPSRSAFRTWLYQQAKYAAADWRRKEARPPELLDLESATTSTADRGADMSDQPSDVLTSSEKGALRRAFRRLRPAQRELLWWRYVEGWTPTEIARVKLNGTVPDKHVKVYVVRAVTRLAAVTTKKKGATDMTKRHHSDGASAHIEAIARDITATVSRLATESDLEDADRSDDEIVTTFVDSIELDDRKVDELWSQLPATDIDERDLVALAQQLTDIEPRSKEDTTEEPPDVSEVSRGTRMARKLRGPRHPFE